MKTGWGYVIHGTFVTHGGESRTFEGAQWSPHQVGPDLLEQSAKAHLRAQYPGTDVDQVMILDFCWTEIEPAQDMGQDMS